jgi:hypothetical protein
VLSLLALLSLGQIDIRSDGGYVGRDRNAERPFDKWDALAVAGVVLFFVAFGCPVGG